MIITIIQFYLAIFCGLSQETTDLTGPTQKSWYLYSKTPEAATPACQPSSTHALDNQWIFFADGTFEYDHGALTQDESCQQGNCCNDLVNLVGTWQLTNNETTLTVNAVHEKGNPANITNMVLLNATVVLLDDDQLVLQQTSKGATYNLEFRKK